MSDVIVAFSERSSSGANILGLRRSIWMFFDFVPESVEVSTSSDVESDNIVRVGDPITGTGSIGLKHLVGFDGFDGQVVLDKVFGFDTIFDEEVVSLDIVSDVLLNGQVMDSVDSQNSGHRIVDGITDDFRVFNISIHMEMHAISTDDSRLSAVSEFGVSDVALESFGAGSNHHQVRSIFIIERARFSFHDDVSGEKSDFCLDDEFMGSMGFFNRQMVVFERFSKVDSGSADTSDGYNFGFIVVVIS